MEIILKPFALLLGWLYSISGNYGLAIILFCLIFKILLFPISIKGRKGMLDMSRLSEKQKELQAKYGRDRQKYSEELANLYAAENVKPSGGCLWTFLPLPLLFALYGVVSSPFTHLMGLNPDQVTKLTEFVHANSGAGTKSQLSIAQSVYENFSGVQAALPDVATQIQHAGGPINFEFLGLNLSSTPDLLFFQHADPFSWAHVGLFLIPIVSAILAVASMMVNTHINQKILGIGGQNDAMNRQMIIMQPILSLWIGFTLPAALGIYWIANSVFAILQEYCSIGLLKSHIAKAKVEAERRAVEQREKAKEQKRVMAEQKKKKAEEAKRIKLERSLSTDGISDSRVGMRAYARGRTYDQSRYEVTPYHDPDDMIKEKGGQSSQGDEAAKPAAQPKKKKNKKNEEELPAGMRLNESEPREPIPEEPVLEMDASDAPETEEKTED